jgi:poly(3-hydroxybutyrate) depolymerase
MLYRTDAPVDHGGGHIWPHPGAAEQVDQIDASALIWEFFSHHRS